MSLFKHRFNHSGRAIWFSWLVIFFWFHSMAGNSSGCSPAAQDAAPKTNKSSPTERSVPVLISVSGTVVDENEKPVASAVVFLREWAVLRDWELNFGRRDSFNSQRKYYFAKTKTDDLGNFDFNDVKAPELTRRNQNPIRWTVVAVSPGSCLAWVKLKQAKTAEKVRLVLRPGTDVEGVVRDSKSEPISGVEVYVDKISQPDTRQNQPLDSPDQFVYRNSSLSPRATTDAEGKFLIPNLPEGRRIGIAFIHEKFISRIEYAGTTAQPQNPIRETKIIGGQYASVSYPVQNGEMDVKLQQGHRLTGRVVDQAGAGVANQKFTLTQTFTRELEVLSTDADGQFESRRFIEAKVRLRVENPNDKQHVACEKFFQFAEKEVERQVEFQMPAARIIRGTLKSEDLKPIAKAKIAFVPNEPDDPKPGVPRTTTSATTNDAGEYEMRVSVESGTLIPVSPVFGYEFSTMGDVAKFQKGELKPPKAWGRGGARFVHR